jgi:hypothetical protein
VRRKGASLVRRKGTSLDLVEEKGDTGRPAGAQQILLDVSQDGQQVLILLDGERLEPTLPDMSAGVVAPQLASDVSRQVPMHPAAEIAVLVGPEREVEVIWHEAVGQDSHRGIVPKPPQPTWHFARKSVEFSAPNAGTIGRISGERLPGVSIYTRPESGRFGMMPMWVKVSLTKGGPGWVPGACATQP